MRCASAPTSPSPAPIAPDGTPGFPGDVYAQTRLCLQIMLRAIADAGGSADHVIRTRVMLVDITRWQEAARAHGEVFAAIRSNLVGPLSGRPACTFVQVGGFIDPAWLVETEADCYVDEPR